MEVERLKQFQGSEKIEQFNLQMASNQLFSKFMRNLQIAKVVLAQIPLTKETNEKVV